MIDGLHGNRSCVAQIMSDMGGLSEDNTSRPVRAYSLMGRPRRTSAEEELDSIEDRLGTSTNRDNNQGPAMPRTPHQLVENCDRRYYS